MSTESGAVNRRAFLSSLAGLGGALVAGTAVSAQSALEQGPTVTPAPRRTPPHVALGADNFVKTEWQALEGRRVGLVTNQTGVLSNGTPLLTALVKNPAIKLRALYSPEHGLHGNHTAGSHVGSSIDAETGLPVYSLYGKTKKPTAAMLADVDVLLFDIQDVGARTYTYISTLAKVMQGAAEHGKSVWVLDRPNPIGGNIVEGPVLEPEFESFIGLFPLPMRHGMTMGEVATLYRQAFDIRCDLHVVRMSGYTRQMYWPQTGLPWIPTSPNIPLFRTAMVYLTTGPLGGAGIVNGVGSAKPFEMAVAQGIDGPALSNALNARGLPGVRFEPVTWVPSHGYWGGKQLSGVTLTLPHYLKFLAVQTSLEILTALHKQSPARLSFATTDFDRDWGTDTVRKWTLAGLTPAQMQERWQPRLTSFLKLRQAALLYGNTAAV